MLPATMMLVIEFVGGLVALQWAAVDAVASTSTYVSSWDSSPFNLQAVTANNLGLLCRACSENFCRAGVNALDLWMDLGKVCVETPSPHGQDLLEMSLEAPEIFTTWSPYFVGICCGLVAGTSLMAGYKAGAKKRQGMAVLFI